MEINILFIFLSFILGFIISKIITYRSINGIMEINETDPEKDIYKLILTDSIGVINNKKYLLFKVNNISKRRIY